MEAGKANVILPKNSPTGITHVIASNARIKAEQEKDDFKAPFYPIQYLEDFLLEVSFFFFLSIFKCLFYKIDTVNI